MNCPINGQPCDKDKLILVMQNINGQTSKFMICPDCKITDHEDIKWKNYLSTTFSGMDISPLFQKPSNYNDLDQLVKMFAKKQNTCPSCGMSFEEMMKIGKAGCATCYEALKPISQVITQCQEGKVKHVGKRPKNNLPKPEDSIEVLEAKMENAVREERYEDAGKIRDAIKNKKPS